jgi:hypothetical protein
VMRFFSVSGQPMHSQAVNRAPKGWRF